MTTIAVINQSTLVSNEDVRKMTGAVQKQVSWHVCPAWGLKDINVWFYPDKTKVPSTAWLVTILDNSTQAGALGYHSEDNDLIDGFIFAGPVLSNGGVVLHDPKNNQNVSVASVLSHEICEIIGDSTAALWSDGPTISQGNEYARELCDAVEGFSYDITLSDRSTLVSVSDFLLPSYFNTQATQKDAPFDYLNKLSAAFSLGTNGYMIVRNSGQANQVFGDMPEWKKAMKMDEFSRNTRRTK